MNTVTLTEVGKSFGRTDALADVSLALAPGITGLLGPNGAGKTTMLRILATALAADRGTVRVMGSDPRTPSGRTEVRRRLGYVPQETGFPRGFTAFSFIDYMAILKNWSDPAVRHAEVRRVVDLVGLSEIAPKRIAALSGGQRRRVVLAQAMLGAARPARARRTDHRPRPRPARSAPRRARSGRGVGHGPDLDPPDR